MDILAKYWACVSFAKCDKSENWIWEIGIRGWRKYADYQTVGGEPETSQDHNLQYVLQNLLRNICSHLTAVDIILDFWKFLT